MFLVGVYQVSVGSYVRFLNLATPPPTEVELLDWCLLRPNDKRRCHVPIVRRQDRWQVKDLVPENWPMILVSWYGANAYSLWVHGKDWRDYKSSAESFLPTEAQWEYAARGKDPKDFPWGRGEDTDLLNVCWDLKTHLENAEAPPPLHQLPLEPVNLTKGQSPFGLRGMAGNVWQWCRDFYDPDFYSSKLASCEDAWNFTRATSALSGEAVGWDLPPLRAAALEGDAAPRPREDVWGFDAVPRQAISVTRAALEICKDVQSTESLFEGFGYS